MGCAAAGMHEFENRVYSSALPMFMDYLDTLIPRETGLRPGQRLAAVLEVLPKAHQVTIMMAFPALRRTKEPEKSERWRRVSPHTTFASPPRPGTSKIQPSHIPKNKLNQGHTYLMMIRSSDPQKKPGRIGVSPFNPLME